MTNNLLPRLILILVAIILCAVLYVAILVYVTPAPASAAGSAPHAFLDYGDVSYDPAIAPSFGTNGAVFQYRGVLTIRDNDTHMSYEVCRFNAYDSSVPRVCKTLVGNGAIFVGPEHTYTIAGINRGWLNYYATSTYNVPVTGWYSQFIPLITR